MICFDWMPFEGFFRFFQGLTCVILLTLSESTMKQTDVSNWASAWPLMVIENQHMVFVSLVFNRKKFCYIKENNQSTDSVMSAIWAFGGATASNDNFWIYGTFPSLILTELHLIFQIWMGLVGKFPFAPKIGALLQNSIWRLGERYLLHFFTQSVWRMI